MSASEHLGRQWFHGTAARLKPGDYITPRQGNALRPQGQEGFAYATTDLSRAHDYAWGAAAHEGRVYEVRPDSAMELDPHDPDAHRTSGRLKVLRDATDFEAH